MALTLQLSFVITIKAEHQHIFRKAFVFAFHKLKEQQQEEKRIRNIFRRLLKGRVIKKKKKKVEF